MEVCCEEREEEEDLDYFNEILGLALNDTETTTSQPSCPSYFEPWQRKCYHFSPSVDQSGDSMVYLTWNQAKVGGKYFSAAPVSLLLS